jgi:hypothetical protein
MKQVIFNSATTTKKSAHDLKDAIVRFLSANGMLQTSARECVRVNDGEILIRPNCANSDFTRALALLQLLFSGEGKPCFIGYGKDGMYMSTSNGEAGEISAAIEYIESHINIEVVE